MRKLIAMLLALAMLLSACACAEGARLSVTDMKAYQNGAVIADLTGFDAELAAATIGAGDSGIRLYFSANDRGLVNFTFGEADGSMVLGYGAGDGFTKSYAFPGAFSLHEAIQGLNLAGRGDWSLVEALRGAIPADCQADGGAASYDGEECAVTEFEMSEEYVASLLRVLSMLASLQPSVQQRLRDAGFDSLQDALEAADLRLSLSGELYEGADVDAVDLSASVSVQQFAFDIEIILEHTPLAEGHAFGLSAQIGMGDATVGATARIEAVMDDDTHWLPLDASAAEQIDPQDLSGQEFFAKLSQGLSELMNIVGSGAMNVMLNNQLAAMS